MTVSLQLNSMLGERLAPVAKVAILLHRERGRATIDDIAERMELQSARVMVTSLCQRGFLRIEPGGVVVPLIDMYGRRTADARG